MSFSSKEVIELIKGKRASEQIENVSRKSCFVGRHWKFSSGIFFRKLKIAKTTIIRENFKCARLGMIFVSI